jgi:hypothetical protein
MKSKSKIVLALLAIVSLATPMSSALAVTSSYSGESRTWTERCSIGSVAGFHPAAAYSQGYVINNGVKRLIVFLQAGKQASARGVDSLGNIIPTCWVQDSVVDKYASFMDGTACSRAVRHAVGVVSYDS